MQPVHKQTQHIIMLNGKYFKTSLFYQVTTYHMPQPVLDGARVNCRNGKVVHPSFPFEVRAEWDQAMKCGACIANSVETASEDCARASEARVSQNETPKVRVHFVQRPTPDPCTEKSKLG